MSVLDIRNLKKEYRTGWRGNIVTVAVDDLSLSIEPGEIYGFLGPNGAGKTTTLKIILGFLKPTAGDVKVFGHDAMDWKVRERIGFLPENPAIYPYLTGYQALYMIGKLFSIPHRDLTKRINRIAGELGMDRELKTPVSNHSRGMRQRVGLAQAMLNDPDLVILDEPMSGLDPIGRKMFRESINMLREAGKTVFFSSHILADIEMICDRIGLLHGGRIVLEAPMTEILDREDGKGLEQIFMEKVGEPI